MPYKVVVTFEIVDKFYSVTIYTKATEQYYLIVMLFDSQHVTKCILEFISTCNLELKEITVQT